MKIRCFNILSICLGMTLMMSSLPENKIDTQITTEQEVSIIMMDEPKEELLIFNDKQNEYTKIREQIDQKKEQERLEKERIERQRKLDKECYFNYDNISEPSGISVEKAYELLKDTTFQTWDIAKLLVDGENKEYPVNAIFMISLTRHESWHGKSELAQGRNNISSWRLRNGDWKYFDSKYQCMKATINLISNEYLNPNGAYYKGTSMDEVGYYYCEGNTWSGLVYEMVNYVKDKYNC